MKSKSQRIFIYVCIVSMLILSSHSTCTDYTIGALCSKSCQAPGVVLDDGASCFCDPNKFVVHSDTMTCERKLRLGYYPVLKNIANSGVTDDKYAHVLETACKSECRTCQFTNDFSTGTFDYCTSCDPTTLPILDLGATKPTCVADIPAKRAMVVIQNNQILGVNNQATKYGGSNSDGTRTTQSQTDPTQNLQSSTTSSTTSTMNTSGGVNSSTTQSNNQVLMSVGMEANLPKVMDIINSMGVLGIGAMKDDSNNCAASMIDERLPLDYQPGIVMLAVACPTDCDECAVTQNGNLACTKAASTKFLQDGMVVASCPANGYLTDGNNCLKCSKNGNGCKTCSKATIGGMSVLQCSACFTELGYALEDQAITGGTLKVCNQKQCLTDKSKYWNGSACVACTTDCDVCDDAKCAFCGKDKYMKIASDGTRTCVSASTGCGSGFFANDQNICQACHTDCATCSRKGADGCLTCSSASKYLLPLKKILVANNNLESDFQKQSGSTQVDQKYQVDPNQQFPGTCVASCAAQGAALYVKSGVCTVCEPFGCTTCDSSGVCTACDKQKGLSLITDPSDSTKKKCATCTVTGCGLCSDTDNTKCKFCKMGYALDSSFACVKDCGSGKTMTTQTLTAANAPVTMTKLTYSTCTACSGDCKECSTSATTCMLCTDSTKFAKPDGTCAASCDAGYVPIDGRCVKCGDNVATCQIDSTTKEITLLTCSNNFYLHSTGKLCVAADKCGAGYFANSGKCTQCDATCTECKTTSTTCTKCADTTKFVSSDGSCKTSAADVTCATGFFKDTTGICIMCDKSCDSTSGCTGPTMSDCKKCASGYKVLTTNSAFTPVTYKCGMKCPPLSEEATVNSQTVCNTCYGTAKPVYDFSTKACIADSATCPSATVKTTLDKISKTNNNDAQSSTVDASTVKICANCDKRCATCLASDPSVCATCASTLLESAMTKTVGSTTVSYAICSDTCADGKYKDGSNKCVNSCLSNCSKCTDGTTCDRCMNGFFLDDSSATHKCVAESACSTGKYGDRISGKCQACQSPCATCKGAANNCLSCDTTSTFYFFDKLGKCYATCPPGTYQSSTNCVPCKTSVLTCDSTGTATSDARSCDSSCNGCVYSPNYCFGCATGKTMAPMGRCVDTCSSDTLLDSSTTPAMCKSCSFGCLKCASETSTCSAGSTATSFSSSSTPAPKCLRCDKNQGFFLLRGRCVKSCPVGTYPDMLTGWCAKCDCNCGTGGCIDRYTCSGCPKSGMSIDLQSGRCKCDATVATAWASDWKSFTITISSTSVRFRDLTAEKANASTNQIKMCRIGNEGSMFDNTSTQSTVTDSFASMRCGDATNTKTEIDYITSQFKNMNVDNSTSSSDVKGSSTSTNSNPSQSSMPVGPGFSSESTVKDGKIQTSDQTKSTTSTSTTSTTTQSAGQQTTVSTTATTCPNQKDTISKDKMNMLGLTALDDASIKKYIQGLGILFGDISDKDIMTYQSPTDGLIFTSSPTDLCAVLFDADTLKYIFKTPTCTLAVSGSNTVITVTLGDLAQIHTGFVVKIQPNVFVDGCDWPIMNVQKVTDASNPGSLNVKFKSQAQSAVSCSSLSVKLDSSGSVGGVSCNISLDTIKDSSGNAITTGTASTTKTSINTSNASSNSGGEFSISSTDMSTLSSSGVSKITLKGSCTDSYGQKQMVSKEITLSNGESDITMKNQPDKIVYDSSQSQDVSFLFDYTNCASTSTGVTSTITLQKMTGTNTWADTTSSSEMISNSKTIPKGLSATTRYRLKVVASAGTKSKEFYIELQSIVKQPDMQTKGIPSFLLASEAFSYTFTVNDFKNVQDLTKVSISFSCKTCSGGKCTKGDSTDLSFNSLYTDSTKTLSIPANTLAANTCYSVSITVAYSGTTNTKDITINTAAAGVKKAIDVGYNFNAGEYKDVTLSGHFGCKPRNTDIKPQDVTTSISLLDSSGSKVTSSCVTTGTDNISYSANCLSSGTTYSVSCTLTSKTDSTITGTSKQSFTTTSTVSIAASITPTSGDQFTSFAITVTNSGTDTIKCSAGIVDSTFGEGFTSLTSSDLQVSGSGSSTFSSISLPVDTQSTYTKVKVLCRSPVTGDTGVSTINVQMSKYTGSDASTKAKAKMDTIKTCASSSTCSNDQVVSDLVSNAQIITTMSASDAQTIAPKAVAALESSTVDTTDSLSTKNYLGKLDATSNVVSKGGLSSTDLSKMTNILQNVLGGNTSTVSSSSKTGSTGSTSSSSSSSSTSTSVTSTNVKDRIPTKGTESVNQLSKSDSKMMMNTISKLTDGITNNKNLITALDFENYKKTFLIIMDKLIKGTMSTLADGDNITFPLKGMAVYLEKISMDSTSMSKEINLSYPCPCGTSYSPTTTSTDPQALDGSINPTSASTITADKQTQTSTTTTASKSKAGQKLSFSTASGMCSVKVPSLNTMSSDISSCKSMMVAVITTSDMSPNAMVSASDSSKFKAASATDSTTSLTTVTTTASTDTYASSLGTTSGYSTSDFSSIQTLGPSIDIAFYCATSSEADTSGKLSVSRVDVTKFNGGSISYSMNCPTSATVSSSQTQVPSFLDTNTGENSCSGCTTSSSGDTVCGHATSFSYSVATFSTATSDWWNRIYANYVLYILFVIDAYFVAVFIVGLIMKRKKSHMKVCDTTHIVSIPIELKDPKVEQASSFDKNSVHSTHSNKDLHTKGFCRRFWTGFLLKYRLITPFSTEHEDLSRIARGAINVAVLLLMWSFSGIITYGLNDNLAGDYCVSIVVCFIIARLFCFLLEFILKSRGMIVLTIIGYVVTFLLVAASHLAIFMLTQYMGSEFYNWGLIVLTIYLIDLIIWEMSSLFIQLFFAKKLAQNPDNLAGKRKFISRLISPPLLRAFVDV